MSLDLVATLSELVATPSVNPMGENVTGPEYFEHRVTAYLERLFQSWQLPYCRQPIAPMRDNILVRLEGEPALDAGGGLLLLEAHQDTVPVAGMTISPFEPVVRDGRLYGRGSCDVKGGMTAMLGAFRRLANELPSPRPTVVLACTVNEEHGFSGATGLCRLWAGQASEILPRQPDQAIVAEPTELNVVTAHKGVVRWRCHTQGRAAHSSDPFRGQNAIFRMARVLRAFERYQREVVGSLGEHRLCGRPTLSVGVVHGGLSVNTVPDRCTIEIDRRLIPDENADAAYQHAVAYIHDESGIGDFVSHDPPFMQSLGLRDGDNHALADELVAACRAAGCETARTIGVPFGTNASCLGSNGVPSVVFGPGSIEQAHTEDEWISLAEVQRASDALYRFVAQNSQRR